MPAIKGRAQHQGRRILGEERAAMTRDLLARYKAGESIQQLADSTGRSYGFVHRILSEGGVTFRPRGGVVGRRRAR